MPQHPTVDLSAFPPGFRWSAATAAFQVEGSRTADGRGRSIWDDFVDTEGAVRDGATAEPGPDSYRRHRQDVALLARLGVDRYRFSISWVRVQPEPGGPVAQAGLDYYRRLADDLLEAGVTPFATLYHWDLPSTLEARGGWLDRDTAHRFGEYAEIVADALGDRITHWYTINEPVSTSLQGYAVGTLAPARQLLFGALPTVHHQLLGHGLALRALRASSATEAGIVNNHTHVRAASGSDADVQAAAVYDLLHNRIFADPILTGAYPDLGAFGIPPMPVVAGDLELIGAAADFYGINFYNPTTIAAAAAESPVRFEIVPTPGAPVTGFGTEWPIVPAALTDLLIDFRERYGDRLPPLVIGENGASFPEPDRVDDAVADAERIAYLAGHIAAVGDAVRAGVDVREYTVWSLLDNFEWAEGWTQRFGLVHVDFDTAARTPKASFDWYRGLIAGARA
ncbi:GH1 family beta-glucosidase [Microbacterium sp. M3]|uniref:Beta-glucosidase n=1 Tax=Microbacterium arthrosphaerae TaxID=792652 RepID=A0ABU4H073_9MICO|nr:MULTISPECIES: GH1 family beta-glucosidase [Microbacterium]MDW4572726.1 GH1 family beta-glucosidase [Microbacterium arthrosphaerae]MDW7606581.1 GH1 family beta-glucosidase [Microbacterium sp. M3]